MSEPFKVRLTGSSSGTLEQVIVQIELVDRAKAAIIRPWAWYRGDDLTGYSEGDDVTGWDDRSGNERHMGQFQDRKYPKYGADVFGGFSGIRHRDGGSGDNGWLDWFGGDPMTQMNGVTVVGVVRPAMRTGADGTFAQWSGMLVYGGQAAVSISWEPIITAGTEFGVANDQFFGGFTNAANQTGDLFIQDTSWPTGPHAWLFRQDASNIGAQYNATDPSPVTTQGTVATPLPVAGLTLRLQNDLGGGSVTDGTVEIIVFDQYLDPASDLIDFGDAGTATINGYLAARYPSLF